MQWGTGACTTVLALFNYRHNVSRVTRELDWARAWKGIRFLYGKERTNYPVTLSVDDLAEDFVFTVQAVNPIEPLRVCQFAVYGRARVGPGAGDLFTGRGE